MIRKKKREYLATFASDKSKWWYLYLRLLQAINRDDDIFILRLLLALNQYNCLFLRLLLSINRDDCPTFFSNTLLRIATPGIRRQSGRKIGKSKFFVPWPKSNQLHIHTVMFLKPKFGLAAAPPPREMTAQRYLKSWSVAPAMRQLRWSKTSNEGGYFINRL